MAELEIPVVPFELGTSWGKILREELQEPYIARLASFLEKERKLSHPIYPPKDLVFETFLRTPYEKVKVVIVGQDPYHGPEQAHGLSFSVPKGIQPPPSLMNIFKEIEQDLGLPIPSHGCLTKWADQGVFLLNATLTVRKGEPLSHQGMGWERFTDSVIKALSRKESPLVFLLWGKSAKEKCRFLSNQTPTGRAPLILTAAHPSPLSCHNGFFGCRHFSQTNRYLIEQGVSPIDWSL